MPDTPFLEIDVAKMDANIERMADVAKRAGVALRPHVKTHKIPELALRQIQAGAVGVTVAKVSEAEVMLAGGVTNIFIAYPLVTESKILRALCVARQANLILGVDSLEGAERLSQLAEREGQTVSIRLEIDTGLRRTGIPMASAVPFAQAIQRLKALRLTGIYTYRGALLDGTSTTDTQSAGRQEGEWMVEVANAFRAAGIDIQDVSVGSTPTAASVANVEGITEIRPGTYVFSDRMQVGYGVGALADCAARMKVTVVSRPTPESIIVDGGSKTFATDVQPGVAPLFLEGFGLVCEHPTAVFERMTEEHGMIRVPKDASIHVGDTLTIIPNHICSTVNLHNSVYLRENGQLRCVDVAARGLLA